MVEFPAGIGKGQHLHAYRFCMKQLNTRRSMMLTVMPRPLARRLLWHPFSLDTADLKHPDVHQPYEKPGVHLFWVLSGRGTLEVQGKSYDLMPGNCVWLVDMAQRRVYRPLPGGRLVKQGFRFGGPAVELWRKELSGVKKAPFSLKDPECIRRDYRTIYDICRRKPVRWEWQVHLIITRILGQLMESRGLLASNEPDIPEAVMRVLNTLAADPFYNWKVKEVAAACGVSYSKVRDLFLKTQGVSLREFVQQRRLDQARLLLADEQLTIKQVAAQLHFCSEFYFSHFFKGHTGVSPTAFKRLQAKDQRQK